MPVGAAAGNRSGAKRCPRTTAAAPHGRRRARQGALLAAQCGTGVLVVGTHFPPPTVGTVVSEGGTYRLVPAPGHTT
ncbi:hypothetical protein [Streptomyces sp. NPDC004230]